jgi:hypothetical protein
MPDPFRLPKNLEPDESSFLRDYAEPLAALRRATVLCPPPSLVGAAATGSLPAEEQASLSAHLASCVACQALADAMTDREALYASEPTAAEEARIWSRIAADTDWEVPGDPALATGRRWRWSLAAAATLLLAALLGTWALRLHSENRRLAASVAVRPAARPAAKPSAKPGALPEDETRGRRAEARRTPSLEGQMAVLDRRSGSASSPQVNVPVLDLDPAGVFRSREGENPAFRVPSGVPLVAVILNSSSPDSALPHALEIRDDGGKLIWKGEGLKQRAHHAFTLTIPRELLPDGAYRLRLLVERRGRRELVETYELRIRG